jgi:hypothetical protein
MPENRRKASYSALVKGQRNPDNVTEFRLFYEANASQTLRDPWIGLTLTSPK